MSVGVEVGFVDGYSGRDGTAGVSWPPSPHRLLLALIASDPEAARTVVPALAAQPPTIVAEPTPTVVCPPKVYGAGLRLVTEVQGNPSSGPFALGRTSTTITRRSRPAVWPSAPVTYVWPDIVLDDRQRAALDSCVSRLGYLGTAESVVDAMVVDEVPSADGRRSTWTPEDAGTERITVSRPDVMAIADAAFAHRWRVDGRQQRYATAARSWTWLTGELVERQGGRIRPSGFDAAAPVAKMLRAAMLTDRRTGLEDRAMPVVLHGHCSCGSGVLTSRCCRTVRDTVCFVPLRDVAWEHATGRILGVGLLVPPEASEREVAVLRQKLYASSLHGRLVRPASDRWTARAERWAKPSARFATVTPVAPERGWLKGAPNPEAWSDDEMATMLTHAGLDPATASWEFRRHPPVRGGVKVNAGERHLLLELDQPVGRPVLLGRSRNMGGGLLVPL